MKTFQVIVDSASNINKNIREELDIDYVKMNYTIGGKDYEACLDWSNLSSKQYYDLLNKGKKSIVGLNNEEDYEKLFTKYLEQGLDILYLGCSSKISGVLNTAIIVANEIIKRYPGRRIACYDSLRIGDSLGLMAIDCAKMANEGLEIDMVVAKLNMNRLKYQTYYFIDSLDYIKKPGRMNALKHSFAKLFHKKHMVMTNKDGNLLTYKKVSGRKKAIKELILSVINNIEEDNEIEVVNISHMGNIDEAMKIEAELKKNPNIKSIVINEMGGIISAYSGPKALSVSFNGKRITK